MNDAERKILLDEIERLAKKVQELKGLGPGANFYGLPLWVQALRPPTVEILAKDNPMFEDFRQASYDAFSHGTTVDEWSESLGTAVRTID